MQKFEGVVEQASEAELSDAAARADRTGLFNCPHTGVAMAGLIKFVQRGEIKPNARVIVVSTAHGLKFSHSKTDYHANTLPGVKPSFANPPVELAAKPMAVYDAVMRHVERTRH